MDSRLNLVSERRGPNPVHIRTGTGRLRHLGESYRRRGDRHSRGVCERIRVRIDGIHDEQRAAAKIDNKSPIYRRAAVIDDDKERPLGFERSDKSE